MKLAEALQERAALIKRINGLSDRLEDNLFVEENTEPSESPAKLLEELNSCSEQLEELVVRINLTNAALKIGLETMTSLLARRDVMRKKLSILQNMLNNARSHNHRYYRSETRMVRTIDVPEMQKRLDRLYRDMRELDATIQQANWSNDLI
ncbi:MAG: DIP1984 family protein [Clostridia bacterium]|nr:DIP1984 family protein [Clostridia bacterium]